MNDMQTEMALEIREMQAHIHKYVMETDAGNAEQEKAIGSYTKLGAQLNEMFQFDENRWDKQEQAQINVELERAKYENDILRAERQYKEARREFIFNCVTSCVTVLTFIGSCYVKGNMEVNGHMPGRYWKDITNDFRNMKKELLHH